MAVDGLFDDGSSSPLASSEYTVETPDTSVAMAKLVKVRARGFDAYFQITIRNDYKVLQSLQITRQPSKTAFEFGQELSTAGMKVEGTFYDTQVGSTVTEAITSYKLTGYSKLTRGTQTVTVSANRCSAAYTVTVRIPASAAVTVSMRESTNNLHFIKGQVFKIPEALLVRVVINGVSMGVTPDITDFSGYNLSVPGVQTLNLTLDDKTQPFNIWVLDAEPHVYFDYGYMRRANETEPKGRGMGAGVYYTKPNTPLVLSVVRFLVGYDENNKPLAVTYTWSVLSGGEHTASGANGEFFTFTPAAAGTYRIKARVTGRSYITGEPVTCEAETDVVCYTESVATDKTFPAAPGLQNFAPGQFTVGGTGIGWSLGAQGGYWVWEVGHQASYRICGNAFASWGEPGVVWFMEDNNGNGIPDEMWYELKGTEDDTNPGQITRRFAVRYFHAAGEADNEYGQPTTDIPWVDSKGRTGTLRGGWPRRWGVSDDEAWVMYTGTTLQDNGRIAIGGGGYDVGHFGKYVDADDRDGFPVSWARAADGSAVTLTNVRFIKVQTAVFRYGRPFGEVSTEIHTADGLGQTTDFPLP